MFGRVGVLDLFCRAGRACCLKVELLGVLQNILMESCTQHSISISRIIHTN